MRTRFVVVFLVGLAFVAAPVATAHAAYFLPESTWPILLLLHHLGVILLFGNFTVSSLWMAQARKSAERSTLYYASRVLFRGDFFFTLPGLILTIGPGVLLVDSVGGFGRTSWAELTLLLMVVVVLVWLTQTLRYQRKMLQVTREAAELRIGLSDAFYHYERRWSFWGGVIKIILLVSLYLMVFKPQIWGAVV